MKIISGFIFSDSRISSCPSFLELAYQILVRMLKGIHFPGEIFSRGIPLMSVEEVKMKNSASL